MENSYKFAVGIGNELDFGTFESSKCHARIQKVSKFLVDCPLNSTSGKRNINESSLNYRFWRTYLAVLDHFISEFDTLLTDKQQLLESMEAFDEDSSNYMDFKKLEDFSQFYDSHIDEVLLR